MVDGSGEKGRVGTVDAGTFPTCFGKTMLNLSNQRELQNLVSERYGMIKLFSSVGRAFERY